MPRGGARPGAGGKPAWKSGKTKTIRVPVSLADVVLAYAKDLDEKGGIIEPVTGSKVVNLSGISLRHHNGLIAIHLEDLVRAGYEILPESLSNLVNARLQKLEIDKKLKHGNNKEKGQRHRVLHH